MKCVGAWLQSIGYDKYVDKFVDEMIDGESLVTLGASGARKTNDDVSLFGGVVVVESFT